MDLMNYSALRTLSRILTTAPQGRQVSAALDKVHTWRSEIPDTNDMLFPVLHDEVCEALKADAVSLELHCMVSPALHGALHAAETLDELKDGTVCQPTWDEETLQWLPEELRNRWLHSIEREEDAEDLVLETLAVLMDQTHSYPLSLELTQYLVTYWLAVELSKVKPDAQPRKETERCIKLAKYLTPWERRHSLDYICHRDGEVFLLDGDMDDGTCEDYLDAIRQAEHCVSHDELKRYLCDRTAQPCFDFELEKAVRIWLGDEYKQRGRPVEPSDARESFDD